MAGMNEGMVKQLESVNLALRAESVSCCRVQRAMGREIITGKKLTDLQYQNLSDFQYTGKDQQRSKTR